MGHPSIVNIPDAAELIGVSRHQLYHWVQTDTKWAACVSHRAGRRYFLSVAKLLSAGFLLTPDQREAIHG